MLKLLFVFTFSILLSGIVCSYVSANELGDGERLECYENCDSMVAQLIKYSKNGSPQAQTILALSYKSGELLGVIDDDMAWKWMKRARNQQYAPALYYISQWYRHGYNADTDVSRANKYLQRAAKKNYPPALLDLGILTIKTNDKEEGLQLIELAADAGLPKAKQLLKSFKTQSNLAANLSTKSSEKNFNQLALINKEPINKERVKHPDDGVITILGAELEPLYIFENILDEIKVQNLYSRKGSTSSRLSDKKCRQLGSGCRVIYYNQSKEVGDVITGSKVVPARPGGFGR